MPTRQHTIEIEVTVSDAQALYVNAFTALLADGVSAQAANELLLTDGVVDVASALVILAQPHKSWAGTQIAETRCA